MAEQEKSENGNTEKPASKAQYRLIGQLIEETEFKEIPLTYTNETMLLGDACDVIDFLKDLKSQQYQDRMNHRGKSSFDKIGFGMCFKLLYNNWNEVSSSAMVNNKSFEDMVIALYHQFKENQQACRKSVEESGQ